MGKVAEMARSISVITLLSILSQWCNMNGVYATGIQTLECYRCNNGYKPTPTCVNEIAKPDKDKDVGTSKWDAGDTKNDNCKTIRQFFSQYNDATGDWIKRSAFTKKKSHSRRRRDEPSGAVNETAFCAVISTYVAGIETPQVFRDCIEGESKQIGRNFRNQFEFESSDFETLPGDGANKCWDRKTEGDKGTQRITVCLCKKDFCNNEKVGTGEAIRHGPFRIQLIISLITATLSTTLLYS